MASVAYLFNTPFPARDPAFLEGRLTGPGEAWLGAASRPDSIPTFWHCFFRPDDVLTVELLPGVAGAGDGYRTWFLASTPLSQAIRNLERVLWLVERATGEAGVTRCYWSEALAWLRTLPFSWLTLDATRIVDHFEAGDPLRTLRGRLAGDARQPAATLARCATRSSP